MAGSLNDKQGAESLEQLEDGARVTQEVVPDAEGDGLDDAILAKEPLAPGGRLCLEDAAEGALDPVGAAGVDGKLSQRPNKQRRDDNPLRQAEQVGDGPPEARLFGDGDADARVGKVVDEEG